MSQQSAFIVRSTHVGGNDSSLQLSFLCILITTRNDKNVDFTAWGTMQMLDFKGKLACSDIRHKGVLAKMPTSDLMIHKFNAGLHS